MRYWPPSWPAPRDSCSSRSSARTWFRRVRTVAAGGNLLDQRSTAALMERLRERSSARRRPVRQTDRTRAEIVDLIGEGLTNRIIAKRMHLARRRSRTTSPASSRNSTSPAAPRSRCWRRRHRRATSRARSARIWARSAGSWAQSVFWATRGTCQSSRVPRPLSPGPTVKSPSHSAARIRRFSNPLRRVPGSMPRPSSVISTVSSPPGARRRRAPRSGRHPNAAVHC